MQQEFFSVHTGNRRAVVDILLSLAVD